MNGEVVRAGSTTSIGGGTTVILVKRGTMKARISREPGAHIDDVSFPWKPYTFSLTTDGMLTCHAVDVDSISAAKFAVRVRTAQNVIIDGVGFGVAVQFVDSPGTLTLIPLNLADVPVWVKTLNDTAQTALEQHQEEFCNGLVTHTGWLKMRGVAKQWFVRYCVVRPPVMIIYRDEESEQKEIALFIINLKGCVCHKRVSKKDGFCFMVENTQKKPIYMSQGLHGETLGKVLFSASKLLLRVPEVEEGEEWIEKIVSAIAYADRKANVGASLGGSLGFLQSFASASVISLGANASGPTSFKRNSVSSTDDKLGLGSECSDSDSDDSDGISLPPSTAPPKPSELEDKKQEEVTETKEEISAESQSSVEAPAPAPEPVAEVKEEPTTEAKQEEPVPEVANNEEVTMEVTIDEEPPKVPEEVKEQKEEKENAPLTAPDEERTQLLGSTVGVIDGGKLNPPSSIYMKEIPRGEMKVDAFEQGKSILMGLIKQIRPGMDLSRVTLPTHILEPRSFLEKTTDYFAHIELINEAIHCDDPLERILKLSRWYISGFHIMPKTPKKPYNPILGETFRCMWKHPASKEVPQSQSFLVCEQVSHHPPISAIYACNRAQGWVLNGSILFKSKFWGTSVGALLEGFCTMTLPALGEEYQIGFPDCVAKGYIVGPLTMEMCNKVIISCKQTGYVSTIQFKTKPAFGGEFNHVGGGIKDANGNTIYTFSGRYDREVFYEGTDEVVHSLWKVPESPEDMPNSVQRWTIPRDLQGEFESERLWIKVTNALIEGDQDTATDGKTELENAQRKGAREREEAGVAWIPKYFDYSDEEQQWIYKWRNLAVWDSSKESCEYEQNHCIRTILRDEAETASILANAKKIEIPAESSPSTTETTTTTTPEVSPRRRHKKHRTDAPESSDDSELLKQLRATVESQEDTLKKLSTQIEQLQRKLTAKSAYASQKPSESVSWMSLVPMVVSVFLMLLVIMYISSVQSRLS